MTRMVEVLLMAQVLLTTVSIYLQVRYAPAGKKKKRKSSDPVENFFLGLGWEEGAETTTRPLRRF